VVSCVRQTDLGKCGAVVPGRLCNAQIPQAKGFARRRCDKLKEEFLTHKQDSRGRSSGILLHFTSLPGPHGIGDLGAAAHDFVDRLASAKQTWWQILPVGPPGAGHSPYQAYSAFAGDPNLISIDALVTEGLLKQSELEQPRFTESRVDFEHVSRWKERQLAGAWSLLGQNRRHPLWPDLKRFMRAQSWWLDDFALFMALKRSFGERSWTDWPKELVRREPDAINDAKRKFQQDIDRLRFEQFLFFRQLNGLRKYAKSKGVKLIGDLPIFVSPESADVWANPHLFLLDRDRRPKFVAGVPPDYFSKTGQRWGNPLYDWKAMQQEGYRWWIQRIRATLDQVDLVRIDHFRGFAASWHVRAHLPTAEKGRWVKTPGRELFEALRKELGGLPFIAEDLGLITPDVEKLRDELGLPGMRVLQFAFGDGADNPFLPHKYVRNTVVYTGTHDNDTTAGWYRGLSQEQKTFLRRYANTSDREAVWSLIRLAWSSVADLAIVPLQDVLELRSQARMNVPGSSSGNWSWRVRASQMRESMFERLRDLTETFGRS
jgi:4-alpha-glucanotransferase